MVQMIASKIAGVVLAASITGPVTYQALNAPMRCNSVLFASNVFQCYDNSGYFSSKGTIMANGFNTPNYTEQGGSRDVIGGSLDVISGGEIDLESGSTFKVAGTDRTTELTEALAAGAILGGTTVAADVLAIPVTHQYVAKTTGADAEALTLANGIPGQVLTISLVTDGGGDGTLTPTTASGWATIVFADAGDTATLKYIDNTSGWVIVGLAGVAAPPAITI